MGEGAVDEGREDGRHRSIWWRVLFGATLLLGLAWVVSNRTEGAAFVAIVQNARPWWLAAAALLQLLTYPSDGMVWKRVLARHGGPGIAIGDATRLALAKFFVDQFLPAGGVGGTLLVMRSLQRLGVDRETNYVCLLIRLGSYYLAYGLALLAAIGIAWVRADRVSRLVVLGVTLVVALFLVTPLLLLWLLRHPEQRLPRLLTGSRWLRRIRPIASGVTEAAPAVGRDRPLLLEATGWQLAIFVADGLTFWAMLRAVGSDLGVAPSYAAFLLGNVLVTFGAVPAGIGVFEAGAVAALALFGVPGAVALTATLLFRGFSLWIPLAPGAWCARRESWR